jgi:hypothetical protein
MPPAIAKKANKAFIVNRIHDGILNPSSNTDPMSIKIVYGTCNPPTIIPINPAAIGIHFLLMLSLKLPL